MISEQLKYSSRSIVIALIAVIALLALLIKFPFAGADFYYVFYPSAKNLLAGNATLYVTGTNGFLYPAHVMFYWMLLALTPISVANAIHVVATLGFLVATIHIWNRYSEPSALKTILAIAGLYTLDHTFRGQLDAMAIFGLVLAFYATREEKPLLLGAGATLAIIKPTNLFLPLLLIVRELRNWSIPQILKASIIPLISILATLLVFQPVWILNWIAYLRQVDIFALSIISTWDMSEALGLPIIVPLLLSIPPVLMVLKYRDLSAENFAFAIVANLLISTYVAGYHYVALIPAILMIRNRWLVLSCWLLSFLPFARLISFDYGSLIGLLPVFIASVLLYQMLNPVELEAVQDA